MLKSHVCVWHFSFVCDVPWCFGAIEMEFYIFLLNVAEDEEKGTKIYVYKIQNEIKKSLNEIIEINIIL